MATRDSAAPPLHPPGADDTMASPRFILKTDLQGLEPVAIGGAAVLDADARLRALLGPDRAALFAEPVVTWGNGRNAGSVSWYAEAAGDPVPLTALPPARRAAVEQRLASEFAALGPLMDEARRRFGDERVEQIAA